MADGYTNPVQINSMTGPVGMPFPAVTPPPMATLGTTATPTVAGATAAIVTPPATTGAAAPGGGGILAGMFGNPQDPHYNNNGDLTNPGFLQKGGGLDVGLGALQTLGNLWNSFQQIKLAKEQFSFQKDAFNTNLANQESAYNTTLENRAKSAGKFNGTDQATTDQYIKDHSL